MRDAIKTVLIIAGTVVLAGAVSTPFAVAGGGSAPVLVTNPASSPIPVTGSVNVGNLPATQAVSGTVSVNNLPSTQPVSGTVSVGSLPAQTTVLVNNSVRPYLNDAMVATSTLDVSGYRTIRVNATVNCNGVGSYIFVYTLGQSHILDYVRGEGSQVEINKTYEVPGTDVWILLGCDHTIQADFSDAAVWGRA
jgi:hypothetical protein